MANTKSAKKAARQTIRRTAVNKARRTRLRSSVRKVEEAIASGNKEAAAAALKEAEPIIARTAQKGVVHRKTASRKVSRLAKRVGAMGSALTKKPLLLFRGNRRRARARADHVISTNISTACRGTRCGEDATRAIAVSRLQKKFVRQRCRRSHCHQRAVCAHRASRIHACETEAWRSRLRPLSTGYSPSRYAGPLA